MRIKSIAVVVLYAACLFASGVVFSRLVAQDRGPSFTLGFRGDDVVLNGSSLPQLQKVICTLTTEGLTDDQPGAQGWSLGVQPGGACRIVDYSTSRMASASVSQGGLVEPAGFERTDILNNGEGIIQAVVLSFVTSATLSPADSPHDLLALYIGTDAPRGEDCQACELAYAEGLQGEGQPVRLVVTWGGESYRPQGQNKEIQICPPVTCFEQGEIGNWTFASGEAASGAARTNADGGRIEICGYGGGYGAVTTGGGETDNVNVVGQTVPGNFNFRIDARIRRMNGEAAYGGLEVRTPGVNETFNSSAPVFGFGVHLDGGRLTIERHVRGYRLRSFPRSVGIEALPIDLRIERRDGTLIGSYSTGGGDFTEFLVAVSPDGTRGSHFGPDSALHVALAQGSSGSIVERRLATATVYFGEPSLEIDFPPPPPPTPLVRFVPGMLELTGEDVESIVSVTIAGLEAGIVSKEDGRATINIPETDTPVRGDIVINWDGFSSVIRNAFFRYGTGFIRGDCNDDEIVDISDAIKIFGYLFLGHAACVCLEAANANGDTLADGTANRDISDGIFLLSFLFSGGAPPPPPFPERGFSEGSDPADICGLEEHLPVITNITVLDREGAAAGGEPIRIREGARLRIDGRNFSSDPRRNTVVAGDARFEIVDATPTRLLVNVIKVASAQILDIGIIRDFLSLSSSAVCFDDDCPPPIIGPLVIFDMPFELAPSPDVGLLGHTSPSLDSGGLVLQLDRAIFSPNASVAGMAINIDAMLDIPVIGDISPGARRVSVTEVFPRTGRTSGSDGVRRVAESLKRGLSGGGRLSEVRIIADVARSRILIEPTVDILSTFRGGEGAAAGPAFSAFPKGVISVYDQPIGRCGPDNLHPIDDERAFGWCRFEELVEECNGLPAFEYFFTLDETMSLSETPEHLPPDDRSPTAKEVMYNLEAYCHIREHRLWCEDTYNVLRDAGEDEIPPFPRAAWVIKTSWVHESITTNGGTFPLAGADTNMNQAAANLGYDGLGGNPTVQDFKDKFYSYVYTGNDPHNPGWPAGRYYLRAIHHTTKDIDDWYWLDAYVWAGQDDLNKPQPTADMGPGAVRIGGCGGSSEDAPSSIENDPIWTDYRLCTNVTEVQRDPGPYQVPEPSGALVGPQLNGDPSAWCGNFLIGLEVPSGLPFDGGGSNGGGGGYDTCLNCHDGARRNAGTGPNFGSITTDFLHSLGMFGPPRIKSVLECQTASNITFEFDIEPVLNNSCAGCHDGTGPNLPGNLAASMDLSTGNSYASIVGIMSEEANPPGGLGMKRIEPNLPDASYLLHKLNGTHASSAVGGSGSQMPPFGPIIGFDDIIEEWITIGAPNN